eukprot:1148593-Pleurochrysis_carterae.AAC.1
MEAATRAQRVSTSAWKRCAADIETEREKKMATGTHRPKTDDRVSGQRKQRAHIRVIQRSRADADGLGHRRLRGCVRSCARARVRACASVRARVCVRACACGRALSACSLSVRVCARVRVAPGKRRASGRWRRRRLATGTYRVPCGSRLNERRRTPSTCTCRPARANGVGARMGECECMAEEGGRGVEGTQGWKEQWTEGGMKTYRKEAREGE